MTSPFYIKLGCFKDKIKMIAFQNNLSSSTNPLIPAVGFGMSGHSLDYFTIGLFTT